MRITLAATVAAALVLAAGHAEAQVCYYEVVPAKTVYYYSTPVYTTVCKTTVTYGAPVYVSSYPACYVTPRPAKGNKPPASGASAKGAVNADQALKDYEAAVKKKYEATKEAKLRRVRARGKIKAQEALDEAQAEIDKINGKKPPKSHWERYSELLKKEESIGKDETKQKSDKKKKRQKKK